MDKFMETIDASISLSEAEHMIDSVAIPTILELHSQSVDIYPIINRLTDLTQLVNTAKRMGRIEALLDLCSTDKNEKKKDENSKE